MVGKPRCHEQLEKSLDQPCLHAANFFEAIGEIASSTIPVATILIDASCLPANAVGAIEALRRTDPSLRVLLSVDSNASDPAVIKAGRACDQVLDDSIPPDDLRRIILAETDDVSWDASSLPNEKLPEPPATDFVIERTVEPPQTEVPRPEKIKAVTSSPLRMDDAA